MTIEREVYTPHSAGQVVGVHANTIRQWTRTYAPLLSATSQEKPAVYTPADVAMFQAIKELRSVDIDPPSIIERMRQVPPSELQSPYIAAPPAQEAPGTPQIAERSSASSDAPIDQHRPPITVDVSAVMHDLAVLVDSRHDRTVERLSAIDERLAAIEQRRHGLVMLIAGVALGVLVTAVAVLLVRLIGG